MKQVHLQRFSVALLNKFSRKSRFELYVKATYVPGNILICIAILKDPYQELSNSFNYFVLQLAFSDVIVGIFTEPAFVVWHIREALGHDSLQAKSSGVSLAFILSRPHRVKSHGHGKTTYAFLLTLVNCSMNQFLYAWRMPNFRKAVAAIVCGRSSAPQSDIPSTPLTPTLSSNRSSRNETLTEEFTSSIRYKNTSYTRDDIDDAANGNLVEQLENYRCITYV
ncbi:hypothetical protein pdam_00001906 [Pocillopora damicornis]|uniref:G-protein coupled receptors family 1 profile domain-containing protein n=1 Tax=Pocillopora damicornis TaxID=46731 RepID=A0A3M6TQ14_POCDA|nr:hypothetical protein pdam_00001906 [Pocillopora damicornis]